MRLQSTGSSSLYFISSSSQGSGHAQLSASRDNLQMRTLDEDSVKQVINNVRRIMSYTPSSQCSPICSAITGKRIIIVAHNKHRLHPDCFQRSLSYYWPSIVNLSELGINSNPITNYGPLTRKYQKTETSSGLHLK